MNSCKFLTQSHQLFIFRSIYFVIFSLPLSFFLNVRIHVCICTYLFWIHLKIIWNDCGIPLNTLKNSYWYTQIRWISYLCRAKETRPKKRAHTARFRLHKTIENANQSIVTETRSVVIWGMGWEVERVRERDHQGAHAHKKLLGVMNMYFILIVVIISWVYI